MESKVEKWLEKRGQDVKEIWGDITKWRLKKCESPIEMLFLIEWYYREREENILPERFPKYFIRPQYKINNKFRVDFAILHITEDECLKYREDYSQIKDKALVIELDSYLWHGSSPEQFVKEKERERYLKKEGWNIMRFSGREIYKDVEKCVEEVINYFEGGE